MRVSFVLRVDSEPLARGQLLGEIEEVSTGRLGGVRNLDDLMRFVTPGGPPAGVIPRDRTDIGSCPEEVL